MGKKNKQQGAQPALPTNDDNVTKRAPLGANALPSSSFVPQDNVPPDPNNTIVMLHLRRRLILLHVWKIIPLMGLALLMILR